MEREYAESCTIGAEYWDDKAKENNVNMCCFGRSGTLTSVDGFACLEEGA